MRLFESLSIDLKLALLSAMTENVRTSIQTKQKSKLQLLHELADTWSDVDEDRLIKDIYESRTLSHKLVKFED